MTREKGKLRVMLCREQPSRNDTCYTHLRLGMQVEAASPGVCVYNPWLQSVPAPLVAVPRRRKPGRPHELVGSHEPGRVGCLEV